jgi:hypothetical protein
MTCRTLNHFSPSPTIPENGSIKWKETDDFDADLGTDDPHSGMTPSGSPPPEHFGSYCTIGTHKSTRGRRYLEAGPASAR